jgi:hypothetical protein
MFDIVPVFSFEGSFDPSTIQNKFDFFALPWKYGLRSQKLGKAPGWIGKTTATNETADYPRRPSQKLVSQLRDRFDIHRICGVFAFQQACQSVGVHDPIDLLDSLRSNLYCTVLCCTVKGQTTSAPSSSNARKTRYSKAMPDGQYGVSPFVICSQREPSPPHPKDRIRKT